MTVILSDERISSPVLNTYDTAILLNQPSIDKFESKIKPGGSLIFDGNGITRFPERKDIHITGLAISRKAFETYRQKP